MSGLRRHPVLISGTGFLLCLASFVIAALVGQSSFTNYMFYVGFSVTAIGVLIGFFAFKQKD